MKNAVFYVYHSSYLLDLAPNDFFFSKIKSTFKGQNYSTKKINQNELQPKVILKRHSKNVFDKRWHHWNKYSYPIVKEP